MVQNRRNTGVWLTETECGLSCSFCRWPIRRKSLIDAHGFEVGQIPASFKRNSGAKTVEQYKAEMGVPRSTTSSEKPRP